MTSVEESSMTKLPQHDNNQLAEIVLELSGGASSKAVTVDIAKKGQNTSEIRFIRETLVWVNGPIYKIGTGVLLLQTLLLIARLILESAEAQEASNWLWELVRTFIFLLLLLADNTSLQVAAFGFTTWFLGEQGARIMSQGRFFWRSKTNVFDLSATFLIIAAVVLRALFASENSLYQEGALAAHSLLVTIRLFSKPLTEQFGNELLSSYSMDAHVAISVSSVFQAIRHLPNTTPREALILKNQVEIVTGKKEGFISMAEMLEFLNVALVRCPEHLSATELMSHLQNVSVLHESSHNYGPYDVIKSTLKHWSTQKLNIALSVVSAALLAVVPPLQALALEHIVNGITQKDSSAVKYSIILILVLNVPQLLGNFALGYFQAVIIAKGTRKLQFDLTKVILSSPTSFFQQHSDGDLNNMFNSDIQRVCSLWVAVFWNLLNPTVNVVFALAYVFYKKWVAGIVGISFMTILLLVGPRSKAARSSKDYVVKNAYLAAEFQNGVFCQKAVRAYGIQIPFLEKFSKNCDTLEKVAKASQLWSNVVQINVTGGMYVFISCLTAALAVSADKNSSGFDVGGFTALVTLYNNIANPVAVIGGFMRWAISNAGSLHRLDYVLTGDAAAAAAAAKESRKDPSVSDGSSKSELKPLEREVAFNDVTFSYDSFSSIPTIKDVSFTVKKGSYTCICGPSGCGKSTVLTLLMRFQDAQKGVIALDGVDITTISKKSYLNGIGVVFQDSMIFNGSVMENIRYGNLKATDEECREAARNAQCDSFIETLEHGYDTILGQHSKISLSGGQAQRICLARGLCRKPQILLLDEATSALDAETEASIIQTLVDLTRSQLLTIISVTHRISTTVEANDILVFRSGSLVERGTYDELMHSSGLFSELASRDSLSKSGSDNDASLAQSPRTRERSAVDARREESTHELLKAVERHLSSRSNVLTQGRRSLGGVSASFTKTTMRSGTSSVR